jgi:hypothetical protein
MPRAPGRKPGVKKIRCRCCALNKILYEEDRCCTSSENSSKASSLASSRAASGDECDDAAVDRLGRDMKSKMKLDEVWTGASGGRLTDRLSPDSKLRLKVRVAR